jgi:hypothetical protein
MVIHLIVNRLGAGKTLLLTFFALYYRMNSQKDIYANFRLSFSDGVIHTLNKLNTIKHAFLGLDDAYMILNSREMKGNREALNILARSRKRDLDIFITSVRAKQIDINVRYNVSVIWTPNVVQSPVAGRPPIALSAIGYEYRPEEEEEARTLGKPLYFICITGSLLRKVMNLYDTAEEIETMDDA